MCYVADFSTSGGSRQPILDVFPSYPVSRACSVYESVTFSITSFLWEDIDYRPPSSPATMDQYLSTAGDFLLGDTTDLPLLMRPLTPRLTVDDVVTESVVGSPAGEPVAVP